jgi:hypothetical protein
MWRADVWLEGAGLRAGLLGERLIVRRADDRVVGRHALLRVQSVLLIGAGLGVSTDLLHACALRGIAVGAVDAERLLLLTAPLSTRLTAQHVDCDALRLPAASPHPGDLATRLLTLRLAWMALMAGLEPSDELLGRLVQAQRPALDALGAAHGVRAPHMLARGLMERLPSGQRVAARLQEDLRALAAHLRDPREAWAPWSWDGLVVRGDERPWQAERADGAALVYYTPQSEVIRDDDAAVV